ncbi:HAMP domain-containing histidine kinase [Patescibacteria group bacterium]|nr:MAG: HAMP domain-containing histidine kinase [Patescibacteria group bacterium]
MNSLTCPWDPAKFFIISNNVPALFYYSHGVAVLAALILGAFLLYKKRDLSTIIFFAINILFSLWIFFDLIEWASNRIDAIYFFWVAMILVELLIYALALYLTNVFFKKTDISFLTKSALFILLLPVVVLLSTKYILTKTNSTTCVPTESKFIIYYSYGFEILMLLSIVFSYVRNIRVEKDGINKRKITLFTVGIITFLAAFSSGNIIGSFTEDWNIAQYGLFGMPIFIGFLVYIIVKFKAFNIKLLGAQALVVAQFAMIGSMFFFATSTTNIVLLSITLAGTAVMGWYLIRAVKLEVQRKEELQFMSDKLANANDQLRKLDNAKSEFISIASHQLRTPLTAIKGFVSLLLEGTYGDINPQAIGALNKVYQANDHLVQLVEDLLNISRIESGRMQYEFRAWKLEPIITELKDNFALMAKDNGLYLDVKLPTEPLPEIEMDGGKIREVISNLISNALKYTKKGGVTMRVEREPKLVRLTVSDTGIGVPADEIPYLFGKFSRGKDTTRLNATGTGLGLYVGREMIAAHHGKIWVESDGADRGSRFIIELPIKHQD